MKSWNNWEDIVEFSTNLSEVSDFLQAGLYHKFEKKKKYVTVKGYW